MCMEMMRLVCSHMHLGNTLGMVTSLLCASLQVKDEDPEDAEYLSPEKASLSASIKAVIMSSLAAAREASDLAVAILEAYGFRAVTSLREYSGLDYFEIDTEFLCAAFSGDCVLLVDFFASDHKLESELAEDLLETLQDLRQVASFQLG
jgi:hypothetical protein